MVILSIPAQESLLQDTGAGLENLLSPPRSESTGNRRMPRSSRCHYQPVWSRPNCTDRTHRDTAVAVVHWDAEVSPLEDCSALLGSLMLIARRSGDPPQKPPTAPRHRPLLAVSFGRCETIRCRPEAFLSARFFSPFLLPHCKVLIAHFWSK
ncbi:hypothetical protein HPB47_010827 [Ixodes persulcatus]|uniref:Uncharacterized protein n=1 Tax=Ixodes persulcatus TaxID=34615 RepID=A0AC60NY13_IXOPE|nr:hypothetical protein HPB47_010827 [Ixodes persulcatus]